MQNDHIFIPVIVQVALTLWLFTRLAIAKAQALRSGQVDESRRGLHDDAWPDHVIQINNCIRNQFESPILFYVLIVVLWSIDGVALDTYIAAWLFIVSRIAHAVIHTGSNYVPLRRNIFMAGVLMLLYLTGITAYRLASI